MRARLALWVTGVRCELREVVLRDKPEHLLELSAKATVPVLWLPDGTVLDESLDIMLWALAQNDPEDWLGPNRDEMNDLIADNDGPFKHHLDRYKYANRFDGADANAHRSEAAVILHHLETRLVHDPFLMGGQVSLADMAIGPFIRQFANTDRGWFDEAPYPQLRRWLDAFVASERFGSIMTKTPQWAPDSEPVWFEPTGF